MKPFDCKSHAQKRLLQKHSVHFSVDHRRTSRSSAFSTKITENLKTIVFYNQDASLILFRFQRIKRQKTLIGMLLKDQPSFLGRFQAWQKLRYNVNFSVQSSRKWSSQELNLKPFSLRKRFSLIITLSVTASQHTVISFFLAPFYLVLPSFQLPFYQASLLEFFISFFIDPHGNYSKNNILKDP